MRNFLVYKNAIIAIAFEISSLHSETQIGENKGRLKSLCSGVHSQINSQIKNVFLYCFLYLLH